MLGSVRPFGGPSASTLMPEPSDLQPYYLVCKSTLTLAQLGLEVKFVGQRSRSSAKNRVF